MSIRPIDILTMAPKSQEASSLHQAGNQKAIHDQALLGVNFQQQLMRQSHQTKKVEENQTYEYRFEKKDRDSSSKNNKKKKRQGKDEKEKDETNTNSFDIKV